MASKSDEAGKTASAANPFAEMRLPGFENMASFGTAWMDAMGDMSAEFASFVAARIQEVDGGIGDVGGSCARRWNNTKPRPGVWPRSA